MYLEHFQLTHSPFAEEPDPEAFFPGARREEICQSLILDVLAGKRLVKLVGREGSGKTVLWRMMAERLPSEYQVVFLDNPMGTLDDLLRMVCIDLGMDPRSREDEKTCPEVLQQLLARKKAENIKLVLIIDEAEKLFLATLERLLVLVAEIEDELEWTTILVGRPGLDANLDQLSVFCARIDVHAGYVLDDLTESETRQYLRFCLQAAGLAQEQSEAIFTEGVIARIFAEAHGNLRLTNILAEEALRAACTEQSFMVLLDQVEPEAPEPAPVVRLESKVLELYDLIRFNKFFAGALAGAVLTALLTGFLLMGNNGSRSSSPGGPTESRETAAVNDRADAPGSVPGAPVPSEQTEIRDGDKLFRERLAASASWLTGINSGKYTIQLMMLVSNQAQASMAMTLVQDDYYQIRGQLFIFRKKTNPPTMFMYHGLYDSLDAAREARNNMPVFLRRHHPYPLAVDDALKKLVN